MPKNGQRDKYSESTPGMICQILRQHKNWTQETLADKSGLTTASISTFENGSRHTMASALMISRAFEITVEQLSGMEPLPESIAEDVAAAVQVQIEKWQALLDKIVRMPARFK